MDQTDRAGGLEKL